MKIVVFGAGLSSTYLINYLEENALVYHWDITVVDLDIIQIKDKVTSKSTHSYP